jgi:hypothetical protein
MKDKFIAAVFSDYDNAPEWWKTFVLLPELEEKEGNEFVDVIVEKIESCGGAVITTFDDDIYRAKSPWVVVFDNAEDFTAFKLKCC